MISTRDAELVLSAALEKGGDFAELYLEDKISNNISLVGGSIDSATTNRGHGAGIRVYTGLNSVYVHTNLTHREGLLKAAEQAAEAVGRARETGRDIHIAAQPFAPALGQAAILPRDVAGSRKADILQSAYGAAKGRDQAISQVKCQLMDVDKRVWVFNSQGLNAQDHRVRTRLAVQAVASGEGENQVGFEGPGAGTGYELFDRVDPAAAGRAAADTALTMLKAGQCPAGEMPVVIAGGFGGVIFHEACGHSLEATAVALGNSEFCGKLGQAIASPVVTAIDDGSIPGAWGSIAMDDEGTPSGKLVLIEKGILKNYMVDRLNSRRMGMAPTGSARRQSYAFAPTSRMRNTYIAAGEDDEKEMIATMGEGLFARKMGGGSVNPVTGEFNFAVAEGYWVKDGKIQRPVRGATLVGRGAQVLQRIDRVGREMTLAEGMCGSVSGSIPVCVGQPTIRVSRMTVGGRE